MVRVVSVTFLVTLLVFAIAGILGKDVQYKVTVYTSNVKGAGTDANVFAEIRGDLGTTGPHKLDDKKNNFEKNQKDEFKLKMKDVGTMQNITVWHDYAFFGSGWHLDKIVVEKGGKTVTFSCNCWIEKDLKTGKAEKVIQAQKKPKKRSMMTFLSM